MYILEEVGFRKSPTSASVSASFRVITSVQLSIRNRSVLAIAAVPTCKLHWIELLQEFEFPINSNCIKQSPDFRFIIATGTYPPRMRCFELAEYGMKFERYMDAEVRKSDRGNREVIIVGAIEGINDGVLEGN